MLSVPCGYSYQLILALLPAASVAPPWFNYG